jgi:hypothetical protein
MSTMSENTRIGAKFCVVAEGGELGADSLWQKLRRATLGFVSIAMAGVDHRE